MTINEQEIAEVYDWIFDYAGRPIRAGKQLQPVIFSCRFINGKLRAPKIQPVPGDFSPDVRDICMQFIMELVERPQIDVVGLVSEAWLVRFELDEWTKEEAEAYRQRFDSLADCPLRVESLCVWIYTKDAEWMASSPIERPSNSVAKTPLFDMAANFTGRFARSTWKKAQA